MRGWAEHGDGMEIGQEEDAWKLPGRWRRRFLRSGTAVPQPGSEKPEAGTSRVAILRVDSYSERLVDVLMEGFKVFHLKIHGKSVLLKPNLVDIVPGKEVTTHPIVVAAAVECFLRLGAKQVVVGEGPGHQRDTELVLHESGISQALVQTGVRFVDLNRDELARVRLGCELDRPWAPLASAICAGGRLNRFHAQDEDSPLGWGEPEHEEHVWNCSGNEIWLAKEPASLAGDS